MTRLILQFKLASEAHERERGARSGAPFGSLVLGSDQVAAAFSFAGAFSFSPFSAPSSSDSPGEITYL